MAAMAPRLLQPASGKRQAMPIVRDDASSFGSTACTYLRHRGHVACTPSIPFRSRLRGNVYHRHRQSRRKAGCIFSVLVGDLEKSEPRIETSEPRIETSKPRIETSERKTDDTHISARGWEKWAIMAEQKFNVLLTDTVIVLLDALYADRNYARFYVLETIARVPYFAFVSVLHMYESFGWWRRADYLKVHFAESWNELHHLLVMEALGGDERWFDRFLAQHIAVAYYFATVLMYLVSPRMAYHFSECVENHAYSTYDKFIKQHGEELKKLPAPEVAVKYYTEGDLYMFDEFQTNRVPESRRPKVDNLYDVFVNIREDEAEHCKTMRACQTPGNLQSPHASNAAKDKVDTEIAKECMLSAVECAGILECMTSSRSHASRARASGIEIPVNHNLVSEE